MANASQLFKDDEEEQQTGRPSDDQLRHITGINKGDEADMERNGGGESSALADSEKGGFYKGKEDGSFNKANADELDKVSSKSDINSRGDFNFKEEKSNENGLSRWKLTRKKGIAGGAIVILLGGGGFGLSVLSGPAQLVQLSHVLQKSFSKNDSDTADRSGHLLRYARALRKGDIAETRVNKLGSKVFGETIKQLSDAGITIDRGVTGAPTKTSFDTEKMKANFPELEGANDAKAKAFISERLGISTDAIGGSNGKFHIDEATIKQAGYKKYNLKVSRVLAKNTLSLLNDGKIVSALKFRYMTKMLNLPSLLHPLDRTTADLENKTANKLAAKKAADDEETKRTNALREAADQVPAVGETTGAQAEEEVKSNSSNVKTGLIAALTLDAGACFARDVAAAIPAIDRAKVVLPAAAKASSLIAVGEQLEYGGGDVTNEQLSAISDGLTDKDGNSVFGSPAMQSLEGDGTVQNPKTADISTDDRQAFAGHSTAAAVHKYVTDALGGDFSATVQCSTPFQLIVGAATLLAAGAAEVFSGGAATPAVVAIFAAKTSAQVAGTYVFMHWLESTILNSSTAKDLAANAFRGPSGGALLAYGARAAGNITSIASGGLNLGTKALTLVDAQQAEQDQQQFASESFGARLFAINDYRSLSGKMAQSISPNVSNNASNMASSLLNIGGSLAHVFSALIPHVGAAGEKQYDWGFSQYGLPQTLLDAPELSDPYDNADKVVSLLNNDTDGVIEKAHHCFGAQISNTNSDNVWDVTTTDSVDPESDDYISSNCNPFGNGIDSSNINWARIVMFIFDTKTMKSVACFQGDDSMCEASPSTAASGAGSSTTINSADAPSYCKDGTASGSQKVVCSAWLFDDYGYNDPGHRGNASFLKGFLADVKTCVSGNFGGGCKYAKGTPLVDCSGLVDAAVYDGTGVDMNGEATGGYPGDSHLQEIPMSQATAGDIVWQPSHTEIVVTNDVANKTLHTFGAHMVYPDYTKDIGPSTYSYTEEFTKAFRVTP